MGDRRLVEYCPHCKHPIGEIVIVEGKLWLSVGGMVGEDPAGLLIDRMDSGRCLVCGGKYSYYSPLAKNIVKILVRRGFSLNELRGIMIVHHSGD